MIYPLVPVALCLILGIISGRYLSAYVDSIVWIAVFIILLIVYFRLFSHPILQSNLVLVISFVAGCMMLCVAERNHKVRLPAGDIEYEAVVASEPVERGKTIRFDMIISSGPLCGHTIRASLQKDTITRHYAGLTVGCGLKAHSVINPPANFGRSNFDYATYLKANGITGRTFIFHGDWSKAAVSLRNLTMLQRSRLSFMRFRHKIIDYYRSVGLYGQGFAVTAAMTLGHRDELSSDMRSAYSAAGVSHVLALSGMHLGIIYLLLSALFVSRRPTVVRETLLITVIWSYVFMVGMPLSVVRSAIMLSIYSVVSLTGRDRMSLNTLAFAALLLLVVNPFCLYDIGFQLSFISVAAIIIAHRSITVPISLLFLWNHRFVDWFWNFLVMSCSAQLATVPLVAYYFGTVPLLSIFSNLVAVPAVTVILYMSVLMLALFFVPAIQKLVVMSVMFIADALNSFILWIASLPGSAITGLHISTGQVLGIYVVMISFCILFRKTFGVYISERLQRQGHYINIT